jgi:hypothetical protein
MIKVCFIYDPEPNEKFLDILTKMTPDCSGKWGDIVGVTRIEEADYCVVIDTTFKLVPEERTIYVQAHPDGFNYPYGSKTKGAKVFYDLQYKNEFAFGEWWLRYTYNELKKMEPMDKYRDVCCIISNSKNVSGHRDRRIFLERLCSIMPSLDVYGRIQPNYDEPNIKKCYKGELGVNNVNEYWYGKEEILVKYKYAIELESISSPNYVSERFIDAMLMYCMPIHWGCKNLYDLFPTTTCLQIDIYREKDVEKVAEFVNNGFYKPEDIWFAREKILDKMNLWAKVHKIITGRYK